MKGKYRTILLLALIASFGLTSGAPTDAVFANGEELSFVVSYKVGFMNTDVAGVTMKTSVSNGGDIYNIEASGKVYPHYRWFFDLNDVYRSRLDAQTLKPVDLTIEISEGKYRASAFYKYDWKNMQVNTSFHNHKNPRPTLRTLPLREGSFDALALFYNLRCVETETLVSGRNEALNLVLEDTVRRMQYKFVGRENKNIKGMGKFRTLKFSCQMVTSTGEAFEDGSEMTLWISDDQNKIPLYVESPIRVGSIRARLIGAKNLKFALDSKIK